MEDDPRQQPESLLPYERWIASALRHVVVQAIEHVAVHGLPGGHHFYIAFRTDYPGVVILAHPECPPDVIAEADYTGSTADMSNYVGRVKPPRVVLLTECSMADNVSINHPHVNFVKPCNLCPHMKRITLPKIRRSLETLTHEVTIPSDLVDAARRSVERMLAVV